MKTMLLKSDYRIEHPIDSQEVYRYIHDVRVEYGEPCERCDNFDVDREVCKLNYKPKKYEMLSGPNAELHYLKRCKRWVLATDIVLKNESWDRYWAV